MMLPYYEQVSAISMFSSTFSHTCIKIILSFLIILQDENTPIVTAFEKTNLQFLTHLIRFGAISALSAR